MEVVRGVEVELLEGVDGEVVEGSVEEVIEGVEEGGIQHDEVVPTNLERMKVELRQRETYRFVSTTMWSINFGVKNAKNISVDLSWWG